MRRFDYTADTANENLALDEALLLAAEADNGGEVLRFWEWPCPAVVLGSACKLAEDVQEEACRADGVPILRRSSGGGTVLLGQGCLCFSLVLAFDRNEAMAGIRSSYQAILQPILDAFGLSGLSLEGICDLCRDGRKFSGNAQQRKRRNLLHHGTILYAFDLPQVARYLKQPPRQPDYRENRPHGDFVANLPVTREWLVEKISAAWGAEARETQAERPEGRMRRLIEEKYGLPEWHTRR